MQVLYLNPLRSAAAAE